MQSFSEHIAPIKHPNSIFVGGEWVVPSSEDTYIVRDSNDAQPYLTMAMAGLQDASSAVAAARSAFDDGPWPWMSPQERVAYLHAFAAKFRERANDMADLWARETGAVPSVARNAGPGAARFFEITADLVDGFPWQEAHPSSDGRGMAMLVREPVGVCAAIIPWNSPALTLALKVAPALLAGNTMVVKASPEAPGSAYVLAEIAQEIGLPPGVINVVTADRTVSESIVRDPRIDKVSFTGSTVAGRKIASIMGDRIGRVTLELGGKSAAVILDDADIEASARTLAKAECMLTGQACVSLTRIVVQRSRHDEMLEAVAAAFRDMRVGSSLDEASEMGPLASKDQLERVVGYIGIGQQDGAVLAAGGGQPRHVNAEGYFIEPTVFGNVDNQSRIAQEEIFGPVLSVIPVDSEEEAILVANDTIYGLNAAVFTTDVDRALRVARRLRSGTVGMNGLRSSTNVGFGGFKQSGIGREGGAEGLRGFTESKVVVLDGEPSPLMSDS